MSPRTRILPPLYMDDFVALAPFWLFLRYLQKVVHVIFSVDCIYCILVTSLGRLYLALFFIDCNDLKVRCLPLPQRYCVDFTKDYFFPRMYWQKGPLFTITSRNLMFSLTSRASSIPYLPSLVPCYTISLREKNMCDVTSILSFVSTVPMISGLLSSARS